MSARTLYFYIANPGATYSTSGLVSESGTIGANGLAASSKQYPAGSYTITFTYDGVTRTDSFTVSSDLLTTYYFKPLSTLDPKTATSTTTGSPAAATSSNPTGASSSINPYKGVPVPGLTDGGNYPFTWPFYNCGKYFTPTQAFMYIGDLFIDELQGFQFTVHANRVPVFGYSSRLMDAIGTGKSLIQGQFSINFVSEGYLYTALDRYSKRTASASSDKEAAALNLVKQIQVLQSDPTDTVQSQISSLKSSLTTLLSTDPNLATYIASAQKESDKDISPAYQDIPFDIVFQFEGGGRTVTKTIKGCTITGSEMVLGDNDLPVAEGYSFTARSVK